MKQKPKIQYVAVIAALCLLSIGLSGCISQSGYEFKGGIMPPPVVSDLMKNGTVVLFITQNDCPACNKTRPMIADLQKQYNGTNVTFVEFNIDKNMTSNNIGRAYAVSATPTIIVLRKDGAAASFIGAPEAGGNYDESTVKSAIEDARSTY